MTTTTPLRVLLTTYTLARRSGGEMHVYDLARELLRRGHLPVVYSSEFGPIGKDLRVASVPVINRLSQLAVTPDIIHSNYPGETLSTMLHFPNTPLVHTCHGFVGDEAKPLPLSRVQCYVAVDDTVRDRLVCQEGISPAKVQVLLNWVDTERFQPRSELPSHPRRVLLFGNAVGPQGQWQKRVVEFCTGQGWLVESIGDGTERIESQPETILGGYDLVFAKAKSAMEAMATGCAVVLAGPGGLGPLVTPEKFHELRRINFGLRATQQQFTAANLRAAVAGYSPSHAAEVCRLAHQYCSLGPVVDQWVALYQKAIVQFQQRGPIDRLAEMQEVAQSLEWLTPSWDKARHATQKALDEAAASARREARCESLTRLVTQLSAQLERLQEECRLLKAGTDQQAINASSPQPRLMQHTLKRAA